MSGEQSTDLELVLSWDRRREGLYPFLRLDRQGTSGDEWLEPDENVEIDLERLRVLEADSDQYGIELGQMLLPTGDIRSFYNTARQLTQAQGEVLHVRLHLRAPARYHSVRWESMRDPESGHRLTIDPKVLFSRYLSSGDWSPIPIPPKRPLRALAVIASPSDIGDYAPDGRPLAEVDVASEIARARRAFEPIGEVHELKGEHAGLGPMRAALDMGFDVLYLVCHGTLAKGVPQLYLESPEGTVDLVDGRDLEEAIASLEHRPSVAMLSSCQSASGGDELWTQDDGDLSALGPRLAAAGIAAVVAMQGNISLDSATKFAPKFFQGLAEHGQVDRAVAAARREIDGNSDWWSPVLYSRLRSGRTYYESGFSGDAELTWRELCLSMETGALTPVLGPGLSDSVLGSRQEMAERWVERWQMPLATHTHDDLTQVAQYLRVRGTDGTVRAQLLSHLASELSRRSDEAEAGEPFAKLKVDPKQLEPAILEVGRRQAQADERNPYRLAAKLPVKVYVTTAWTSFLQEALRAEGREPITRIFRWNQAINVETTDLQPSDERPLVYHLFGHLEDRDSLVLSEDDFFAWFTAWLKRDKDVPSVVKSALTNQSLLFLGFQLDAWGFRVIFHAIKSFAGSGLLKGHQHAGVQINPMGSLIEPDAAQEYLESYFGDDNVDIYWEDTASFLDEFLRRIEAHR